MALCKNCKRDVGCSCNLHEGYCAECYTKFKNGLLKFKRWLVMW